MTRAPRIFPPLRATADLFMIAGALPFVLVGAVGIVAGGLALWGAGIGIEAVFQSRDWLRAPRAPHWSQTGEWVFDPDGGL